LIKSRNIGKGLKFDLYFKYEAVNPTGSFKDRGSSVEVAKALEFGTRSTVCASTGNMGASVSAYSAIAKLGCSIYVPRGAVKIKLQQIKAYGAKIFHVNGDYTKAERRVEELNKTGNYLLGDYLHRREGTKSVGYEIAEQINADYIFSPIGNGTLISAVWKGLREFKELRLLKRIPKLVGVQANGCNPVFNAFKNKTEMKPIKNPHTIAVAIECGNPLDGKRALLSLEQSKGFVEQVSDKEILKARELLAKKEGLFAEPAGAVSLAGLLKSRIPRGSKVVCIVTGHGLKTPYTKV